MLKSAPLVQSPIALANRVMPDSDNPAQHSCISPAQPGSAQAHSVGLEPAIEAAIAALFYPSETDAPLRQVCWPSAELSAASLRQLLQLAPQIPIEQRPVAAFFDRVTCTQPDGPCAWHGPDAAALAAQYQALQALLETELGPLSFYRIGTVTVDAYVVGQQGPGLWRGVATQIVET